MRLYQFIIGNKKPESRFTRGFVHFAMVVLVLFAFGVFLATLLYLIGINVYGLGMGNLYISSLVEFVAVVITILGFVFCIKLVVRLNS